MKLQFKGGLLAIFFLMASIITSASVSAQPLTSFDFNIVGLQLKADPEYQAVPKGIATQVNTFFDAGEVDLTGILDKLPQDYTVRAELSGPAFQTPLTLVTRPGQPFDIPTLALLGKYTLANIRLADNGGNILFGAVPQAVSIESIDDPLITEVSTRPLTVEELQERGVTFDSSNFTAYEFTAAIGTESGRVPLNLPVLIPSGDEMYDADSMPPPAGIGLSQPPETLPLPKIDLPENISISGFMMSVAEVAPGEEKYVGELPPIPGILVIPGNIGFLHQYFSALSIVSNGAPEQSNLVVTNVQVKLIMPIGEDLTAGTDAAPGDDPLRMAKGVDGFFPRELPVLHPGADGSFGTSDDISQLYPAESGQADFTIEGLKEGTHKLDFEITATLEGLPIGPVALKGYATGAVLVRNPDFSVTMGHPATVRSGEAYDLFVTISNTGKSIANLVSLRLDPRAISGAVFAGDENPDKQINTIMPGSSSTVKYRLISQRTGKVTATAFASEDVDGRFILRTGVGENGIPLSPDSLILPYIGDLPPDLINATVGLLGQAWSVATAPSGALPADVLSISKQVIVDKANNLSETGLRLLLGDTDARAIGDLAFDLLGSDEANRAFDSLRRSSTQGALVNEALAAVLQAEVENSDLLATQANLSSLETYREAHLSLALSEAPVHLQLTDSLGNRTGGLNPGNNYREIPYADRLILSETDTARSALMLATRIEAGDYTATIKADAAAVFNFGVVVPDAGGMLQQLRFAAVNLPSDGTATLNLYPGTDVAYSLNIDNNGDGVIDDTLQPTLTALFDRAPTLIAATQIVPGFGPGGDEHGRTVAVLFSERVDKVTAEDEANYLVEANGVRVAYLQPGGRIAFILLNEGVGPFFERTIAVENIFDGAGQPMQADSRPITITAEGPAAKVSGTVRLADGTPVPNATVRLLQPEMVDIDYSLQIRYFIITEKVTDAAGNYSFDYVLQDPDGPFMIQAINPETNEMANLTTSVTYHGQDVVFDLFMQARGNVTGTVSDSSGNPVANAQVLLNTLEDHRGYVVTADAGGHYAFTNVNVGPFSIKANSQTLFADGNSMGILPDEGGSVVQDVTIYPLDGIARGSVAGKVTNADGTPRAGVVVIVKAFLGNSITYSNWIYSGADGAFSFTGVHARDNVRVEVRDDATGETGQVNAQLLEGETAYFNVILQGTAGIEGLVKREDLQSAEGMLVSARVGSRTLYATVDATDHFIFTDLPVGAVALRLLNPENYALTLASQTITLLRAGDVQYAELFVPISATVIGTITGTVYRLDGSIAAGAEVRLVNFAKRTYIPFMADNFGRFEIPDLNSSRYSLVVINGREICNQNVEIFYHGQIKDVDLRPFGFATISGTVYDEGSDMMPVGADVSLYGMQPDEFGWLRYKSNPIATTKSDPQIGTYRFTNIYQGNFSVRASNIFRPTPAIKSGKIVEDGESIIADLVLKESFGSISGQVLLPDGTAAGADIRVSLVFGGAEVAVTTDEAGLFAFRPIVPAGRYRVTAEDLASTLLGQSGTIVSVGADTVISIRLLGRGTLNVLAQNADGTVEAGADVTIRGTGFPQDTATGTTDTQGVVTLSNLSEGNYAITATGSASRGGRASAAITSDGETVNAVVTLASYGKVVGTFFKADRVTPVAGGQLTLKVHNKTIGYAISSADPATLGQFVIDYVPLGPFNLEGYDPVSDRIGRGGGQLDNNLDTVSADVVVVARGTVKGSVLNYSGTSPVGRASVNLYSNSSNSFNYTLTAAPDGSFEFTGVPEGLFTLNVTDPETGLRGQVQGTISFEGETRQVEIHIAASGSIEGVVLMPDGTPATNVAVNLNNGLKATVNPADGTFFFTDLAIGTTYSVFAQETGTNRAMRALASLAEDGEVARPEIILAGIGTIEGKIYDAGGVVELSGATVQLSALGAVSAHYTQISNIDGSFSFTGVPVSDFSLTANHPGLLTGAAASGALQAEGEVVSLSMQFGDIASVKGRVMMPDGTTPANGGVARFVGGSRSFNAVINSDGYFYFNNIPLCSFNMTFEDSSTHAIGKTSGAMTVNGEIVDVGTIVLDDKPIAVVGVTPASGTINVPVGTEKIFVKFSEPADINTLNATNIKLFSGATRISAAVQMDADGLGAQIIPTNPLVGYTLYTVVISGVQDKIGWTMEETFTCTFTTIDNIPPTVVSVSPKSGTIQVDLDAVVRVTFSEPVNADNLSGVQLLQGGFPVATQLDLTQSNTVAILTPVNTLQPNLTYTFEVRGVEDTAGNVLVGATLAQFNSLDTLAPSITGLTVAADAILIEGLLVEMTAEVDATDVARIYFYHDELLVATDSEVPFTAALQLPLAGMNRFKAIAEDVAGNRGTSTTLDLVVAADQPPTVTVVGPADGSVVSNGSTATVSVHAQDDVSLVEIGLTASGSAVFNQVKVVAGVEQTSVFNLFVPVDALPGSEILLTASATDLFGQTVSSATTTLVVADKIAPVMTLNSPGKSVLYVPGATGSATIDASDAIGISELSCRANGAASGEASWVFDPNEKSVSRELTFTVAVDANSHANIYLNCSAGDTSGNTSVRSLTLKVADVVAPVVTSSSVANGAVDVAVDSSLTVIFDEPLTAATVTTTTVLLTDISANNRAVVGQVSLSTDGRIITLTPEAALQWGTSYQLTLLGSIEDVAGNALLQDYVIGFTTLPPDVTPPSIVNIAPNDGSSEVSVSSYVVVTFDEPIDPVSVNTDSIDLSTSVGLVAGNSELSSDGMNLTFKPDELLEFDRVYYTTVKTGLVDISGNMLTAGVTAMFRTMTESNLLRAVYYDTNYNTSWSTKDESAVYHSFLVANGFISLNANQLKQFMIENGPNSVVVMAQDMVPDTVAENNSPDALIRQYMDKGGSVVWTQRSPFYHVGTINNGSLYWGDNSIKNIFGVTLGILNTNSEMTFTNEGIEAGLSEMWASSIYPVLSEDVTTVFAFDSIGQASSWFKNFNLEHPKSGFYRIWDFNGVFESREYLQDLLAISRGVMTDASDSSLVAKFHADGNWFDTSGNKFTGKASDSTRFSFDSLSGYASGDFRADSDSVEIGNLYGNFPDNAFTIDAWVKVDDTGNGLRQTIAGGVGQERDYAIGLYENQIVAFAGDGVAITYAYSGFIPNIGEWYHVAGSFDGGILRLYINGELTSEVTASWQQSNGQANFYIGSDSCCSENDFNGLLDEVGVYNRALSVQEILDHYSSGLISAGNYPSTPQVSVTSKPSESQAILTGIKDIDASILIDGVEVVAVDGVRNWTVTISTQPGTNIVSVRSRNKSGNESASTNAFVLATEEDLSLDYDADGMLNGQEEVNGTDPMVNDSFEDSDRDDLTNLEETRLGTNPLMYDTDADGLSDGVEVRSVNTDPLLPDSDNDGLLDGLEVNVYKSSPLQVDSDGDILGDGWEVKYGYDPILVDTDGNSISDAKEDPDGDGLINKWEYLLGLDPKLLKTDGNIEDGQRDGDRDGWNNFDEANVYFTDPSRPDTDGDGVIDPDEKEVLFSDPNNKDDIYEKDFVLDGKSIRIEGSATFSSLVLQNGAIISTLDASSDQVSSVEIIVIGELSIDPTSKIDVSGRGYLGGYSGDNLSTYGRTLGNTNEGGSRYPSGASYGGLGGKAGHNSVYGDLANPNEVGSGGGSRALSGTSGGRGGNGGGLVRIIAKSLVLDGSILSNGANGIGYGGGGSGGGVRLDVSTLSGTGSISTKGGETGEYYFRGYYYPSTCGGGGGGRIAIYYTTNSFLTENINAGGGMGYDGSNIDYNGGAGTIYLKSAAQTNPDLIVDNQGLITPYQTIVPGGSYAQVLVEGGATIYMQGGFSPDNDMVLDGSTLTVDGSLAVPGNLTLINSVLSVSGEMSVSGALTMDNGDLTLIDSLIVSGAITLNNGSVISHYAATTDTQYMLNIEVLNSKITIDATSKIDVSGRGYLGARQGDNTGTCGRTFGNTNEGGSCYPSGASYGGLGGKTGHNNVYGDLVNPNEVGSGGSGNSGIQYGGKGGNGGGLVRIVAKSLVLDGSILANGANGIGYGGGGSGGGIRLDVSTLSGAGSISTNGGESGEYYYWGYHPSTTGGGGGGRIAIYYTTNSFLTENINAGGGMGYHGINIDYNGGAGTIYMKSAAQTNPDLIIDNQGLITPYQTIVPGGSYAQVLVEGGAMIYMQGGFSPDNDMVLDGSTLTVDGSLAVPGNLILTNSVLSVSGEMSVSGDLVLDNGDLTLIDSLIVSGAITLNNDSVISHYAASIDTQYMLNIEALTSEISIDATSKIDVSGRGYLGSYSGDNASKYGRTLGNIEESGSYFMSGGSYGGSGGKASSYAVNNVYGDLANPNEVGSGGGGGNSGGIGGNGGGLVRIVAKSLTLEGSILANGADGIRYGAGGSGGGIRVDVDTLTGAGSISAKGGESGLLPWYGYLYPIDSGGGGGGRIAIYYKASSLPTENIDAGGGTGYDGSKINLNGGAGTIYLKSSTSQFGGLIIDNNKLDNRDSTTLLPSVGQGVAVNVTPSSLTVANSVWSPDSLRGLNFRLTDFPETIFTIVDNTETTLFLDPFEVDLTQFALLGSAFTGVYQFDSMNVMGMGRVTSLDQLEVVNELMVDESTIVINDIIAGQISLQNSGMINQWHTTITEEYQLKIDADTISVDSTSSIDSSSRGYLGGRQPGNPITNGRTLGNTTTGGSTSNAGGSYGGLGGLGSTSSGTPNLTYGDQTNPNELGSGGSADLNSYPGGNGGGLIRIVANLMQLDGSVKSNGGPSSRGGGSGGGIRLDVGELSGMGTITASGGSSSNLSYGGGGGGRIAIYPLTFDFPFINVSVDGGVSSTGDTPVRNGQTGTIYIP